MATIAQINANRNNANGSTGPRTPEGKSTSARNAATHNLFAQNGFVSSNDRETHNQIAAALLAQLQPEGPLEEIHSSEIVNATWRLHRCSAAEAALTEDPLQNEANFKLQHSIDRARSQAFSLLRRATAELRALQTERLLRETMLPEDTPPASLGVASYKDFVKTVRAIKIAAPQPPAPAPQQNTKQTQSVGRNAQCPCGSGVKYKRCCGTNAPPLLNFPAPSDTPR